MEAERRRLYRQGVLLILVSVVVGLVAAAQAPHANKWLAVHVTGLMTGLLVIASGALWPEVRLAPTTRARALQLELVAAWTGFAVNVYAALVNLPGPVTEPGRAPDAAWEFIPFFIGLAIVVPTTLGSLLLVFRGLTGPVRDGS